MRSRRSPARTRNFWKANGQRTVTIVPDTPAKRREYEDEVVRTFYLSNADLKETIDILRIVVDARRLAQMTATNAITIKDTPERIAAAGRIITALDKARPEVVIDVELLEVDRTRLKEYGLQIASPGSPGIDGQVNINRDNFTLHDLRNLTQSDVFLTNLPGLYYRLLKTDTATRVLANPQLRTAEGLASQASFGERVPVPVTTFSPIAAGGVQQQPITSFNYENIGVNIDITPRTHHDDEVSLAVKIQVSSISGTGFGGLPTFGNRAINTVIRLKDGETNMLAGLIRDNERMVLDGVPGLSDLPVVGRLFAHNRRETQETDIILTLTPRIVRVLDLRAEDLVPFRVGRDSGAPLIDIPLPAPFPVPARPPGDCRAIAAAALPAAECAADARPAAAEPADQAATASAAASIEVLVPVPVLGASAGAVPVPVRCCAPRHPTRATWPAHRLQPLDELRVAALDDLELIDPALPARREGGRDERHTRPDVAAVELLALQLPRAGDDDPVRVAEKQIRAHSAHLLERIEPQLVHPVVHERRSGRLRRQHGHEADEIARESGPQSRRDAAGVDQRARLDTKYAAVVLAVHVHALQHGAHDFHVFGPRSAHLNRAVGDGADDGPTPGLDVVAPERSLRALQVGATVHGDGRASNALDAGAHRAKKLAELHDMRLARGVTDLRAARCGGRRQERGLGARDRRFVEVIRRRLETVWRLQRVSGCLGDAHAHVPQRVKMRPDAAARREIAAGRRDDGAASTSQERPHQQHRPAKAPDQRPIGLVLCHLLAADAQRRRSDAVDLCAHIEEKSAHHLDIRDARHVGEDARLIGQQARRNQRQRGVLVAFDVETAVQAMTAFDDQGRHKVPRVPVVPKVPEVQGRPAGH